MSFVFACFLMLMLTECSVFCLAAPASCWRLWRGGASDPPAHAQFAAVAACLAQPLLPPRTNHPVAPHPFRLLRPGGVYSFFNGLAPDNMFFHLVSSPIDLINCAIWV